MSQENPVIAVVIPCYKVKDRILGVLARIPAEVTYIICVDDGCPENSGAFIKQSSGDKRVQVVFHESNQGVGGAMVTGYKVALDTGADVIVKIDGDGQMSPELISLFTAPILKGLCDYTKGNRFSRPEDLRAMPSGRLLGNGILSFLTKLSSGYWGIFDPTNGFTAIHARVLRRLPLDKLDRGYFFESDILFRLNVLRAMIMDIPMQAVYTGEVSSLRISRIFWSFLRGHIRNFCKRVVYSYFLRDFNIASVELVLGILFLLFGIIFGLTEWHEGRESGITASAGTVMLSALPVILGFQMLMSFLQFDIQSAPRFSLHQGLSDK